MIRYISLLCLLGMFGTSFSMLGYLDSTSSKAPVLHERGNVQDEIIFHFQGRVFSFSMKDHNGSSVFCSLKKAIGLEESQVIVLSVNNNRKAGRFCEISRGFLRHFLNQIERGIRRFSVDVCPENIEDVNEKLEECGMMMYPDSGLPECVVISSPYSETKIIRIMMSLGDESPEKSLKSGHNRDEQRKWFKENLGFVVSVEIMGWELLGGTKETKVEYNRDLKEFNLDDLRDVLNGTGDFQGFADGAFK